MSDKRTPVDLTIIVCRYPELEMNAHRELHSENWEYSRAKRTATHPHRGIMWMDFEHFVERCRGLAAIVVLENQEMRDLYHGNPNLYGSTLDLSRSMNSRFVHV